MKAPREEDRPSRTRSHHWLLIFAVGVIGVYASALHDPEVYRRFAIGLHEDRWFSDTRAVLLSSDLFAQGGDPLVPNRVAIHFYSKWWFGLDALGINAADTAWVGLATVAAWLFASIIWIRPAGAWQALFAFLVMASPAYFLGFNRGNVDLPLLASLLPLPWLLTTERRGWRWLAPALIAAGTGLKYYPLLAWPVLLWARGRRRQILMLAGAGAAMILIVMADVLPAYLGMAGRMPMPTGFLSFGGASSLETLGVPGPVARWLVFAIFGVVAAAWCARPLKLADAGDRGRAEIGFVLGACVLAGCFVLSGNFIYRLVFAVLLLPWLFAAARAGNALFTRVMAAATITLLVLFLWGDGLFGFFMMNASERGDFDYIRRVMPICQRTMAATSWLLVVMIEGWLVSMALDRWRVLRAPA